MYPGQKYADSCDEFPPASTKEGGQNGDLCAELTPQIANGVWSAPATWPGRPTSGTETCLRLHITQRANSSAGGVLGSLRKHQRLVDGDPFRIEFTA
ncbi:NucA/NucB deoxyribonuclease domain-containing protein [Streptomyces sp. HJ7]